ncbi:GL26213 [Drosophila persimilis]|uniref:GL26213 n=1 Tax=Drosophila persimilis TaxID=7234 RepID=B4GJ38_DROPE|nr:GL26213 [Drosophila persimilis]
MDWVGGMASGGGNGIIGLMYYDVLFLALVIPGSVFYVLGGGAGDGGNANYHYVKSKTAAAADQ